MGRIVLEIEGRNVKITSKNCAKLDMAIGLKELMRHVFESGVSTTYLQRYLGIKVNNICKPDKENGT